MHNKQPYIKEPFSSPSYFLKKKRINKGKEIAHDFKTIKVAKVIAGGFVGESLRNNARKRHLWAVLAIEKKKAKVTTMEKGSVISFSNDDYLDGFDHDHDNSMVIIAIVHNYTIKRIFVD